MKKNYWLALGGAVLLGVTGYQLADAGPAWSGPMTGPGCCRTMDGGMGQAALSPEDLKAREEFLAETTALRRQVVTKKGELQGLMAQDNPDEKKVAALTGELYDLRNELRQKASERGLSGWFGSRYCLNEGMGPGRMGGRGHHRGFGPNR